MNKKFTKLMAALALLTFLAVPMGMRGQTTYQLQQVTTVEVGGLYVFEQGGHVMNNTVSSSALQTTTTYATTGLIGTETYVWTLETATDGFYLKNVSLNSSQYLNNSSSTNVSFGNKSSIWNLNFQTDQTVLIQNKSNSNRFLGYTNSTSYAYKAYATNNLDSYSHAIKVYQLVEEGSTPTTYSVTFDAGEGTFVGNTDFPSTSNTVAAGTYTLPSATPATGYTFDGWVATGITTPITGSYTVSGAVAFTAHYTQNTTSGTATYTITSTSAVSASGQAPSGSSATFSQTYGTKFQMTSGNSMTLTLSGYQGKVVTGITLNMRSNGSAGAGWMYAMAGNNTLASIGSENNGVAFNNNQWNGSYTSNYTDVTIGMSDDGYAIQNNENLVIFIKATQNSLYCQSFTITYESSSSITRPQFSPAGGIFTSAQNVTISSETGATIYYTTDGSQPTTNSTLYNGAISIESTTTLKAIAVVNGESSNVTSATYTIVTPLTTMQAIFDNATATPASHEVAITFGNWVVSGHNGGSSSNYASTAWLTDGEKGCQIYGTSPNYPKFNAGDVLSGTVICNLQLNNGSARITGITSTTTDINGNSIVTTDGSVTPIVTTIDNLEGVNTGSVVKFNHLRCTEVASSGITLSDGTNTIVAKKFIFSSLSLSEGKIYDLTGVYEYSTSSKTIYPRSEADVVEAPKATLTIGNLAHVTGLNVFYVYDEYNPIISEGQSSAQQQVYVGEEIKVSPEVAAHCAMQSLTVTDGYDNPVTVTDHMTDGGYYSFIMPSSGATIAATASVAQQYTLTVVGDHVSITQLLVGEESDIVSLDANNQALIYEQAEVEVDGLTIDAAYMIESVTIEYGNTSVEVTKNSGGLYAFTMPSSNATLTFTTITAPTYTLANSIESGKTYIIVNQEFSKAMGHQNSNNRAAVEVVLANETITVSSDDVYEFVISTDETNSEWFNIYDDVNNGYLYAAGGSGTNAKNYLKTQETLTDNGRWTISFNEGKAIITAQGDAARKIIRYNNNDNLFSCYASGQKDVYLYVKDEPATETYTKDIVGNTWYFISSPTGTAPTNVDALSDLFFYDEQDHYWRNKKIAANADGFDFGYGKGYLCANGDNENIPPTITLSFTGTLLTGNTYSVPVTCHTTTTEGQPNGIDAKLAGWNLVGNPFNSNATLSVDCYILNGSSINTQAQTAGYVIAPFAGVMVKASETGSVLFTKVSENAVVPQLNQVQIEVGQKVMSRSGASTSVHDNAIINFNEGSQLEKFIFNPDAAKLYIPQDNKEFAIVSSEANGEMPVCFKATKDGEYTITVSPEGVELNYLHLIDNMTGMDVDLLQTPSYTFEASTRDYESRFKLVFASASTDSATDESFAYYDGSEWKVSNEGEATLQVVDVIGRIVKSETINGNFSLNLNQKAGVYMLRLVNGENVKVQKVVVR